MTTALFTHPDCLEHVTPDGHPERVARLEVILRAFDAPEFAGLDRHEAPLAEPEHLRLAHPQSHIDAVEALVPGDGLAAVDPDTFLSPGSLRAALRGAGAQIAAVDAVMSGAAQNAFCAVRPPGHHAEATTAMGFCFFGNVVIGARHAMDHHGLSRVAIVDFDVHHGNGTQDLVWDDARILFASTHQAPLYPGTGGTHETGAHGNILNKPLPAGAGGPEFRRVMERDIMPALDDFAPEMVFISAGFDAHRADPLANLNFDEADFVWATQELCALARTHAKGRVVSTLEGGYDLQALAASTTAHVQVLMEEGR